MLTPPKNIFNYQFNFASIDSMYQQSDIYNRKNYSYDYGMIVKNVYFSLKNTYSGEGNNRKLVSNGHIILYEGVSVIQTQGYNDTGSFDITSYNLRSLGINETNFAQYAFVDPVSNIYYGIVGVNVDANPFNNVDKLQYKFEVLRL